MRRWVKVLLIALASFVVLGVAGVVALVVWINAENRPAKVPDDFERPTALPPSADPLPDGALLFDSDRTGNFELFLTDQWGNDPTQLTDDTAWDSWWPRLSPDRRRIAFHRSPPGVHDTDFTEVSLWMMNVDGSGLVQLRPPGLDGWTQQGHVEWSPDGSRLVMFGGDKTNPQIFVTDATGSDPEQITDRGGTNIDPSFSPDGESVIFVGCPRSVCFPDDYELYLIPVTGGDARRLTDDGLRDHDPYFSPDGTRIAWLTQTSEHGLHPGGSWNIRIASADGSDVRLVTDDRNINSKPEWSRDGSTIFFHRLDVRNAEVFSVFAIAPDGTGMREVTAGQPGVNEFPST